MPSSIFSHQAPGILLKIKYPKRIDGTAACLGAFIPDLCLLMRYIFGIDFRGISHSLLGQVLLTIPLTLIATILFSRYIGPFCAKIANREGILSKPLKFIGMDDWYLLRNKKIDNHFWIVATYSAFIGGITHILLDWPSHRKFEVFYPWIVLSNPEWLLLPLKVLLPLIPLDIPVYRLLWSLETIFLFVISLYYLRFIKRNELLQM
ncbi:MAG: DUF4184 family protein [Promethearchaeota archaeon]